mmetsp:Transcript_98797/g.247644  ORF Transcript_98797/g.247644 Transcript_98797/m.247644 type:complete len:396 (-) Transcript_98797:289-1476(-)
MAFRSCLLLCIAAACAGPFVVTSASAGAASEAQAASGACPAAGTEEAHAADDACLFQHRVAVGGSGGSTSSRTTGPASQVQQPFQQWKKALARPVGQHSLATELVSAVYTFGGPATKQTPFRNLARADGCFGGLRVYNEDPVSPGYKRVDAASVINQYAHAFISTLALHWAQDSYYIVCNSTHDGHPDWPKRIGGIADDWGLHSETNYVDRLKTVTVNGEAVSSSEPFKSSLLFSTLAWKSYDTTKNTKEAIAEKLPGWTLVGKAVDTHGSDTDPVMIAQESETLDCAVIFTGTNDPSEFSTSIDLHHAKYCGFDEVHAGYRNELWTLSDNTWQPFVPLLEQCNKVFCVGHSLAGSICEIFAACLNSGHVNDPDFQKLAWTPKTPALLPEYDGTE